MTVPAIPIFITLTSLLFCLFICFFCVKLMRTKLDHKQDAYDKLIAEKNRKRHPWEIPVMLGQTIDDFIGYTPGDIGEMFIMPTPKQQEWDDVSLQKMRSEEYGRLRGNMLCVDVSPCTSEKQYSTKAVAWIEPHKSTRVPKQADCDIPTGVTWNAGDMFAGASTTHDKEAQFRSKEFKYYGGVLIQAILHFQDGSTEVDYIYARLLGGSNED